MTDPERNEIKAWQRVVQEFPGDVDSPINNRLFKAIKLWGEMLAQLRLSQDRDKVERCLDRAEKLWQLAESIDRKL